MIRFKCRSCGFAMKVDSAHAGKKAKCSKCSCELQIPKELPQVVEQSQHAWHFIKRDLIGESQEGPISESELLDLAFGGTIKPDTPVLNPAKTKGQWQFAKAFPKLMEKIKEGNQIRAEEKEAQRKANQEAQKVAREKSQRVKAEKRAAKEKARQERLEKERLEAEQREAEAAKAEQERQAQAAKAEKQREEYEQAHGRPGPRVVVGEDGSLNVDVKNKVEGDRALNELKQFKNQFRLEVSRINTDLKMFPAGSYEREPYKIRKHFLESLIANVDYQLRQLRDYVSRNY